MPGIKTKNMTAEQKKLYEELHTAYVRLCREVDRLETEGKSLRREIKEMIGVAKMKNILHNIIKQPD